jgi:hypothetical protein
MLGNDPLQNYLKFYHGGKDQLVYEANTLGSIYQLGMDKAAELWNKHKKQYTNAKRFKVTLSNGWTISGETDHVDDINLVIFDNKVSTATTVDKVRTQGKNNTYALQMGVYKFLMYKLQEEKGIKEPVVYPAVLPIVDKNFSYFKKNKHAQQNFEIVDTYSVEDIELMLINATNELDNYIEMEITPPQCKDLWFFGIRGEKKKPMRCRHYCDQNSNCTYYSTTYHSLDKLLDL